MASEDENEESYAGKFYQTKRISSGQYEPLTLCLPNFHVVIAS